MLPEPAMLPVTLPVTLPVSAPIKPLVEVTGPEKFVLAIRVLLANGYI
jgi:hypothetical protein